jgi:hypothetical protein
VLFLLAGVVVGCGKSEPPEPAGPAEQLVPDPIYAAWKRYPPGTRIVEKGERRTGDAVDGYETTITLVKVTPEKATVSYVIVRADGSPPEPAVTYDILRAVSVPAGGRFPDARIPKGVMAEGEEPIEFQGQVVRARAFRIYAEDRGVRRTGRVLVVDTCPIPVESELRTSALWGVPVVENSRVVAVLPPK